MAQSVLEMTTDLVKAHLETYRLSPNQLLRMLQRTHAKQMMVQRQEETDGRATKTILDKRT
jgi:hypothetical protein